MIRSQRKKGQKYPLLKQNQNRVHKAILTQTCVCSTTWIRQCVVSVFFKSVRVTWQRRKRESLGAHTTPTACKTPTLAVFVPRWTNAARTEGARKERRQSRLACRCSQRQGLFPLGAEVGGGGNRKGHVHIVNIYTHTLRLSLPAP